MRQDYYSEFKSEDEQFDLDECTKSIINQIMVVTSCDGEYTPEIEVEFLGVQEDMEGRDLLTFKCPKCGEAHTSYRLG